MYDLARRDCVHVVSHVHSFHASISHCGQLAKPGVSRSWKLTGGFCEQMKLHLPLFRLWHYMMSVDISAPSFDSGVSEVDEGPAKPHDRVRHVWRLPDYVWLSGPGAGAQRHSFRGTGAVQHHRDHPEQRHQHLHRLPDLPHRLKNRADNRWMQACRRMRNEGTVA